MTAPYDDMRPSSSWRTSAGTGDRLPLLQSAALVRSDDPGPAASAATAAAIKPSYAPSSLSPRKRIYMVTIFCITAALLYADQNLMAPNLTAIATSFGFDEAERDKYLGGYVSAGFYMVGAPAALLFGYLSDTVNRRNLLFAAVLLGEGPCILTYFVTSYWQLFVLRLLTGISLGGTFPLVFSLLSDMYEPHRRAGVSAAVQVATGAGLSLGQGVAGFMGSTVGWRWPFVAVAVPAIGVATLMILTTEEPRRGGTEAAVQAQMAARGGDDFEYSERITWSKTLRLIRIPTNVLVIAQGLPGCLPWGMLLTFLNDYLAQDRGLSVAAATTIVLAVGLGGGIGVIGGGLLGQTMYNRCKWHMPVFIGTATMLGAPPMWYLINHAGPRASMVGAFIAAALAGALSSTVGPNMRAMMMNVNEPETRGVALALQTTLDDVGKGLGPALVAALISNTGRKTAFNIATAGWIPCGMLLLGCAFTLERDEAAMQHRLQTTLSRVSLRDDAGILNEEDEESENWSRNGGGEEQRRAGSELELGAWRGSTDHIGGIDVGLGTRGEGGSTMTLDNNIHEVRPP